jgi:ElaB/YqjD/DUF883 family membrane-anchored ribosome-binding protein
MYGNVRQEAVEEAKIVDHNLREKPYHALGIAVGIGALLGFLISRR